MGPVFKARRLSPSGVAEPLEAQMGGNFIGDVAQVERSKVKDTFDQTGRFVREHVESNGEEHAQCSSQSTHTL